MTSLTFIHAADLHLDSPFKGMQGQVPLWLFEKMRESTFRSFTRIIDKAIVERVDFVILAGDLYDAETRSLRAQLFVRDQLKRLEEYGIQVYIIHGNHDHLGGNWEGISFSRNVHVFSQPYVEQKLYYRDGVLLAALYGFSYHQKAVRDNMTAQYKKMGDAPFHIGLLHGSLESDEDHSRYAPFSIRELQEKNFDYWALGHIHKRSIVGHHPPIVYPGNIQGRHRKELGEKGCYLVRMEADFVTQTFIPTSDLIWHEIEVSIENLEHIDALLQACYQALNTIRNPEGGALVSLIFSGCGELSFYLKQELDEFIHILQSTEEREDFVYIIKYENHTISHKALRAQLDNPFFASLLGEGSQFNDMDSILRPLRTSASGRQIEMFSEDEKQDIQKEAKRILLRMIGEVER
ncbi:DNA repair exonuclease [Ectobacillus antri]|jgi:exonuclease SbcD|uniref:DNA repair exonuclease n=1 Tax=Ectobacillus antri TaxID=2486280 RepID=A0ABT6H3F6_9BACI|nr:DNA repair exonuclease [Ectobacillus antri]MDG4656750.1 DNA repair exonuclease [Ectobacillus antri]MDG5753887.1 DNA repair exonuclease [Ectobacillus antri]